MIHHYVLEHSNPDEVDKVHRTLSQPLRRDDAAPRVTNPRLVGIPIPSWWVDDEEAGVSSMRAAKEIMR